MSGLTRDNACPVNYPLSCPINTTFGGKQKHGKGNYKKDDIKLCFADVRNSMSFIDFDCNNRNAIGVHKGLAEELRLYSPYTSYRAFTEAFSANNNSAFVVF